MILVSSARLKYFRGTPASGFSIVLPEWNGDRFRGDLLDRADTFDRLQGYPSLEIGTVFFKTREKVN
jgi:hypothetical protein